MDIIEYLSETEYAVRNIINLISHDRKILNEYKIDLDKLKERIFQFEGLYSDFVSKDISEDFGDAEVMQAYRRYYIYEEQNKAKKQELIKILAFHKR